MKYLSWFIGIIVTLFVVVYVLAFTPFGNSIVGPIVEKKIQEVTKLDSKLSVFSLNMSEIEIFLELNKNNTIKVNGSYSLFSQSLNLEYNINLEELKTLASLTSTVIDSSLHLNGTVVGDKTLLKVDGNSDIASSKTTFLVTLQNFEPTKVKANIDSLKIQEVLSIATQPHYTDGLFNLDVDITNANVENLSGSIKSSIRNGMLDTQYLSKTYQFKSQMPKTTFDMSSVTSLNKSIVDSKIDFNSNLANFDVQSAKFNAKDKSLDTDYTVSIVNLDKLFFVTDRHLKGSIKANGQLVKTDDLDFTMYSQIAGGKLQAKLHNDDFHADLSGMNTLELLDMLLYPQIFKSFIHGVVDYNIVDAKGKFKGSISDGHFTKNQVLDLAKQYAAIDMYKEIFKGDVNANINKENIVASLDLKSNRSAIVTKDTKLNSATKKIDSKIDISANGNDFSVVLKGDVNAPEVIVDADELIKKEATKAITKEASKYFKGLF